MRNAILSLLLICSICFADNQLYIFYINGVNNTPDEANFSLSKLESLIDNDSPTVTWNVLYNQTHGLMRSDVWDVIRQKHEERIGLDYTSYKNSHPYGSPYSFLHDRSYVGKNLHDIVSQLHNKISFDSKDYLLIISHSQGNQYANQLWDYLVNAEKFPRERIALIGIATPASHGEGLNFSYITADNDKVINVVRTFPENPLEANAHIEKCKDFGCHNLVKDYLGDETIRTSICKRITTFMKLWLNMQQFC